MALLISRVDPVDDKVEEPAARFLCDLLAVQWKSLAYRFDLGQRAAQTLLQIADPRLLGLRRRVQRAHGCSTSAAFRGRRSSWPSSDGNPVLYHASVIRPSYCASGN